MAKSLLSRACLSFQHNEYTLKCAKDDTRIFPLIGNSYAIRVIPFEMGQFEETFPGDDLQFA